MDAQRFWKERGPGWWVMSRGGDPTLGGGRGKKRGYSDEPPFTGDKRQGSVFQFLIKKKQNKTKQIYIE